MKHGAGGLLAFALSLFATASVASFHTFKIEQIYSNADGTVQYVVLHESLGANFENLLGVHSLKTTPQGGTTTTFPFVKNLPNTNTANKRVLIASSGFAALGLITPDYVFANGFVPFPAGTVDYAGVDQVTYTNLPTDGVNALNHSGVIVRNLATNYAGQTVSLSNTCGGVLYPFPYTDVSGVAAPFCLGIMEAYVTGVSKGTSPTNFSPNATVVRLQMTTFLQRELDQGLTRASRRATLNQWSTPQAPSAMQTIAVGAFAESCAADGNALWTSTNGQVVQVQASTGKLLGTWTGATASEGVLVAAGRVLVAGNLAPGALYVIDPTQSPGAVVTAASNLGNDPFGVAFDGTHLWTVNNGGSVSIITPQASTPYPVTTVTTGFANPFGILYDGAHIWVTDTAAGTLLKLDPAGAILQTVVVGAGPEVPGFDGTNIWVPNASGNSITVVQASTGNVVATINADASNLLNGPTAATFDGERVLVTNTLGDTVTVFKAADLSLIGNVSTGVSSGPFGGCSDGINFWIPLGGTGHLLRF
jgi:hypothetical protein